VLALGCQGVKAPEPPPRQAPAPRPAPSAPAPPAPSAPTPPAPSPPRGPAGVYGLDEALDDALSGPLTYIGTGPWTGNQRVQACAYRNDRVIVVNAYCTVTEVKAFRVDVFSPTRGRVRIYAEARAPISTVTRREYFTFTAESEPPAGPRAALPPLTVTMTFPQLLAYDQRRYERFLPSCHGGVEIHRRQGGCARELGARGRRWAAANRAFLDAPPAAWYRIVRELRALARRHGRDTG
jgi:hypothetical protein